MGGQEQGVSLFVAVLITQGVTDACLYIVVKEPGQKIVEDTSKKIGSQWCSFPV